MRFQNTMAWQLAQAFGKLYTETTARPKRGKGGKFVKRPAYGTQAQYVGLRMGVAPNVAEGLLKGAR